MPKNYILRTVREEDIEPLYSLTAAEVEPITTLPPNRDYLSRRVHDSIRSLYPVIHEPGPESYLFVLEDTEDGSIHGASAIFARTGGFEAFYTYEIQNHVYKYEPLNVENHLEALHLKLDHKGPSEIGSLYLSPKVRSLGLGKLTSLARFLFIAQFPERFAEEVIVELRGVVNDHGVSPFWEAIGKHFFGCDYMTADSLSAKHDKTFLQHLMPKFPIYIPLLPAEAQEVIGKVHKLTKPALRILEKQGFRYINEVDIFDAGPAYKATTSEITTVKNSQLLPVRIGTPQSPQQCLLANTALNFRATSAAAEITDTHITITQHTADLLETNESNNLRFITL